MAQGAEQSAALVTRMPEGETCQVGCWGRILVFSTLPVKAQRTAAHQDASRLRTAVARLSNCFRLQDHGASCESASR